MSFHLPSGHEARDHHHETAREQAHRLTLGASTETLPRRRPHRADLPDVDLSRVTRIPRRSLLKGLAAMLGLRSLVPGTFQTELSGSPPASDGERVERPYVGTARVSARVPGPTSSRRLAA